MWKEQFRRREDIGFRKANIARFLQRGKQSRRYRCAGEGGGGGGVVDYKRGN